jgi:iron(III) transport system permease protein
LPALLIAIVAILVVAPLLRIVLSTLTPRVSSLAGGAASPLSANLWWRPLFNTMILGFSVAERLPDLMGGFLAWLVVLTDVPGRRFARR